MRPILAVAALAAAPALADPPSAAPAGPISAPGGPIRFDAGRVRGVGAPDLTDPAVLRADLDRARAELNRARADLDQARADIDKMRTDAKLWQAALSATSESLASLRSAYAKHQHTGYYQSVNFTTKFFVTSGRPISQDEKKDYTTVITGTTMMPATTSPPIAPK